MKLIDSRGRELRVGQRVRIELDIPSENGMLYKDLDMSELTAISSSITQVHEDSPFLNEIFEGESWKRVIKNIPTTPKQPKDKDAS